MLRPLFPVLIKSQGLNFVVKNRIPSFVFTKFQIPTQKFFSFIIPNQKRYYNMRIYMVYKSSTKKVKIYTKTGDKGTSSLFNGERRKKNDIVFDVLGTIDELNANVGVSYEYALTINAKSLVDQLPEIQSRLLDLGSHVATPINSENSSEAHLKRTSFEIDEFIASLEKWIDEMNEILPPLRNFILPSGGLCSAHLHVTRAVCRRSERMTVDLLETGDISESAFKFLNRLSDYFFMSARYASHIEGKPEVVYKKERQKSQPNDTEEKLYIFGRVCMNVTQNENYNSKRDLFIQFLRSKFPETGNDYLDLINQMIEDGATRLIVNLNDFLYLKPDRTDYNELMTRPHESLPAFEDALNLYIKDNKGNFKQSLNREYYIGFEGSFGSHKVSPRQLHTGMLGYLVCVEGIVTKLSLVKPKLVESVHYCPATQQTIRRAHRDTTALNGLPTATVYPTHDNQRNPLETEFGLSLFKDYQTLYVQEMPERAPPGQLPRSVQVLIEHDLVDSVKAGDRVRVMGIYRAMPESSSLASKSTFQTLLLGNNIQRIGQETDGPVLTAKDIGNIRAAAKAPDIFDTLSSSLAPSIYGHDYIKKAILLQLLGGEEKDLKQSGIRLRGDINILLVGDPGTAKSQLLRFVMHVAPLCISTTGRGASGVGLTAAVVQDKQSGDRVLEAGAMILADRGIVCIDEFDKMSSEDRVSIHEVMEQQTVTIAKAGIHASLNARCSVLGAANPLYGKYDRNRSATENIALPDSLLSRFDLLFIVLDTMDPSNDRNIADHVLRMHRYFGTSGSGAGSGAGTHLTESHRFDMETVVEDWEMNPEGDSADATSIVWVPYDKLLHGQKERPIFSIPFIKKYLLYAKTRFHPVITEEAQNCIIDAFEDLRQREDSKTLPVTPRMVETMLRLTVAHAKIRLSHQATIDDAKVVLEIMRFALYNDTTGANTYGSTNSGTASTDTPNKSRKRPFDRILGKDSSNENDAFMSAPKKVKQKESESSMDVTAEETPKSEEDKKQFEQIVLSSASANDTISIAMLLDLANQNSNVQWNQQEILEVLQSMEEKQMIVILGDDILLTS